MEVDIKDHAEGNLGNHTADRSKLEKLFKCEDFWHKNFTRAFGVQFQQLIIHSKLLITLLTNPAISACKERQIKFKKDFVCPFDQTTCHKTKSSTPNRRGIDRKCEVKAVEEWVMPRGFNLLPLYIPCLIDKLHLYYTFQWQMVPLLHASNLGQNRWKICTSPPPPPPQNQGWEMARFGFWLHPWFGGGEGGGWRFAVLFYTVQGCSLELCIPFNCCQCAFIKSMNTSQNQAIFSTFSHLFNTIPLLALLGLFTDPNDRFPCPFIHVNKWNPYPFIYLKPEKDTPFGRSLPV